MEVHAPEHPIHTWREFLIHMGTIVLGLLIAIGLEQTVEWMHHRHQQHDLEEQMLVECEHNEQLVSVALANSEPRIHWFALLLESLQHATPENGRLVGTIPPTLGGNNYFVSPSRGTWSTAKSAGLVALLPAAEAKMYDRLDFNAAEEERREAAIEQPGAVLNADFALAKTYPSSPGKFSLTPELRDKLLVDASAYLSYYRGVTLRLRICKGGMEAVAHGARTLEDLYPYQQKEVEEQERSLKEEMQPSLKWQPRK